MEGAKPADGIQFGSLPQQALQVDNKGPVKELIVSEGRLSSVPA